MKPSAKIRTHRPAMLSVCTCYDGDRFNHTAGWAAWGPRNATNSPAWQNARCGTKPRCCQDTSPPRKQPGGHDNSILIPAYAFDRGNVKTFTNRWADAEPMVGSGGETPVVSTTTSTSRSAASSRSSSATPPRQPGRWNSGWTARSWPTAAARRPALGTPAGPVGRVPPHLHRPGKRTVTLRRDEAFPHVVALRFDSSVPLPGTGSSTGHSPAS